MRWLTEQFGEERLRKTRVILPLPEFFPDPYDATVDSAYLMFNRICGYMRIPRKDVQLKFFQEERSTGLGTSESAAGMYIKGKKKSEIWIEISNLKEPLSLAATMAHELAHVELLGRKRITAEEEDHEPLTDLLTVFLGLGVITSNSVLRETSYGDATYSSWSIRRAGYLSMRTFGYALALFAHARDETNPAWARHLRPDVHGSWKQGMRYLAANAGK